MDGDVVGQQVHLVDRRAYDLREFILHWQQPDLRAVGRLTHHSVLLALPLGHHGCGGRIENPPSLNLPEIERRLANPTLTIVAEADSEPTSHGAQDRDFLACAESANHPPGQSRSDMDVGVLHDHGRHVGQIFRLFLGFRLGILDFGVEGSVARLPCFTLGFLDSRLIPGRVFRRRLLLDLAGLRVGRGFR